MSSACLSAGWAPGTRSKSSGAPGSKNPEEELPPVPSYQFAFWATFTISELRARRRFQGVTLTFQLLQAACHLRVLFPCGLEEGGVWPAVEPKEWVWPFLGEHLKGSWKNPECIWEGAAGPTGKTPEQERREFHTPWGLVEPPV